MSRPLGEQTLRWKPAEGEALVSTIQQSGRAFAAAAAAVMVAVLVVGKSEATLRPVQAVGEGSVAAGVVSLSDDDGGAALFEIEDMTPGSPVTRCVSVIYDGTALPADLAVFADVAGELAPFLETTVTVGAAGGFDDCREFLPAATVYDGSLTGLSADDPVVAGRFHNSLEVKSFQIELRLINDGAAMGESAVVSFLWEASVS